MKVIDNFLPSYNFKQIESSLLGTNFSWYYNDEMLPENHPQYNPNLFQFTHTFYATKGVTPYPNRTIKSEWLNLMDPVVERLGGKGWRIKANMGPRTTEIRRNKFHIDFPNIKTAVYFINTNNGWTEFQNGDKVESVANRIVIFDSNTMHTGTTCTDEKVRVLINFNYAYGNN